ncbi:MAG: glycosyltransferase [Lewinellaceae bacterium]|nr:glycosyltransferase [Saprospiraceae bacterium]MCB9342261.1 glycosyltransferase [Lewinellaceae bacterium]
MKLLIVSAWYKPFVHPRAHRWSALAEYWAKKGHEVHVITARVNTPKGLTNLNGVFVHRVGFDSLKEYVYQITGEKNGRGRVDVKPAQATWYWAILEWLYRQIWKRIYFPDDTCIWYFPAKRKLLKLLSTEKFDGLITVSLPFTDHLLGLAAKEKYLGLPWIADTGDPFSFQAKAPNSSFLYTPLNKKLEKEVLTKADAVTVTVENLIAQYATEFGADYANRLSVIPPLLHPKPVSGNNVSALEGSKLVLSYFGSFYAPTRSPEPFIRLLERAALLFPEFFTNVTVEIWGEVFPEFYELFSKNPLVELKGLRSREQCREAMFKADVLINIGNTTDFQLPSKAVDYLVSGRPVFHLSFVKSDPFRDVFLGHPAFYHMEANSEVFSDEAIKEWVYWLGMKKVLPEKYIIEQMIQPFLIEQVSQQYIKLISDKLVAPTPDNPEE